MNRFKGNKFRTLLDAISRIRNWHDVIALRLSKRKRLKLLEFRDGVNLVVRGETDEWNMVYGLFFAGEYRAATDWLAGLAKKEPTVLDLGANIGMFGILTTRVRPDARIIAFEPGPPNLRILRMNLLANPESAERITLRDEAVAGVSGQAKWHFDARRPGGSSLYGQEGGTLVVNIVAFSEVVEACPDGVDLVKMDIEGAEYDLLENTPASTWDRVGAVIVELHNDPAGRHTHETFLEAMEKLGFRIGASQNCTYFLSR